MPNRGLRQARHPVAACRLQLFEYNISLTYIRYSACCSSSPVHTIKGILMSVHEGNVHVGTKMLDRFRSRVLALIIAIAALLWPCGLPADLVTVRYKEGLLHGFLILRTEEGAAIAVGDWTQIAHGESVTGDLVFHFKDGSLYQETTVFSQRGKFQLLKYHLAQKGPTFQHPTETWLNASTGQFTVHYQEDDGKEKNITERVQVPADVANGMVTTLLKNVPLNAQQTTWSMVVATPKPRVIKLAITFEGEDPVLVEGSSRKARHYRVKVELGGVAGVVAPLLKKQPPDSHVWIMAGEFPVFVRSSGALYEGGPIWTVEQTTPAWPGKSFENNSEK